MKRLLLSFLIAIALLLGGRTTSMTGVLVQPVQRVI